MTSLAALTATSAVATAPTATAAATPAATPEAACASDAHPDRWTDLPALRVRGRANPDYAARLAALADQCATCPLQRACLDYALTNDVAGVWAGTDEYTRIDLRHLFGLPAPTPVTDVVLTAKEQARDQARTQTRHVAAARTDLTQAEIADLLGLGAMAVTRFLDDRDASA